MGHSKEKRSDCPLVTLALVLDSRGFPKKSEVFTGHASAAKTLAERLEKLDPWNPAQVPTVVLDAAIASEANTEWLAENHSRYWVVSRKRHRQFDQDEAVPMAYLYGLITDLEAVFRCLTSELGLRPVFHHKTDPISAHLFISVLAYHLVHTIRFQLKACGIKPSREGVRRQLAGQDRVTFQLNRADGRTIAYSQNHPARIPPSTDIRCTRQIGPSGETEKTII